MWVSKQTLPASNKNAADVLRKMILAVDAMAETSCKKSYKIPNISPVEIEWTGSRSDVGQNEPRPDMDENAQYKHMMSGLTSDVTVLFFHGGAFYLMDPASHRITVARLAKYSGGRCMSVRYRLAPQHQFPAALLDCLIAYMSLLRPPPEAFHKAVPSNKIVFCGDSAGGNLSLALLQLILEMHRQNKGRPPSIRFHGKDVSVSVPAGLALQSPWVDLTRSLPSIHLNARWDYLPPLKSTDMCTLYKADSLWPVKPPRADLYCEAAMLLHPLVSPLIIKDWGGSPPLFLCVGQECLTDEDIILARRFATSGIKTELWCFEAMPHVFPAVLAGLPGATMAMQKWADAINRMAAGNFETRGTWVHAITLQERIFDIESVASHLADGDVDRRLRDSRAKRELAPTDIGVLFAKL